MRTVLVRLATLPVLLLALATATFILTANVGDDPIYGILSNREMRNEGYVQQVREEYGLDQPLYVQYARYVARVIQGDLGTSFRTRNPVLKDLMARLPVTLELVVVTMVLVVMAGVALGCMAAARAGTWVDAGTRIVGLVGLSVPVFWVAVVALYVGSVALGWFPGPGRIDPRLSPPPPVTGSLVLDSIFSGRWDVLRGAIYAMALPVLVLAWSVVGIVIRLTRASMLEAMASDFVQLAVAKGASPARVFLQHALRASLLPLVTMVAHLFGILITGAVFIEVIFRWPGVGEYLVLAAAALDYPAILGVTLVSGTVFVLGNLAADLAYLAIDPRTR